MYLRFILILLGGLFFWSGGNPALFGKTQSIFENLNDLEIRIPTTLRGLSGPHAPGPWLIYKARGVSFLTRRDNQVSGSLDWKFSQTSSSQAVRSDPVKLVEFITRAQKTGNHTELLKFVAPGTSPETLDFLNGKEALAAESALYADATEASVLLIVEAPDSTLLVYYYVQKATRKSLQMERLRKIGTDYFFVVEDPKENAMPINLFTALFGTLRGESDIEISSQPHKPESNSKPTPGFQ